MAKESLHRNIQAEHRQRRVLQPAPRPDRDRRVADRGLTTSVSQHPPKRLALETGWDAMAFAHTHQVRPDPYSRDTTAHICATNCVHPDAGGRGRRWSLRQRGRVASVAANTVG